MLKQSSKRSKKVRVGDKVVVIAGNCKGQIGTVVTCMDDKVLVQGINLKKKTVRRSEQNPKGGFIDIERPIHVSNVSPCDDNGVPLKVRARIDAQGEKELYYQKDGQAVTYRSMRRSESYKSNKRSKGGV